MAFEPFRAVFMWLNLLQMLSQEVLRMLLKAFDYSTGSPQRLWRCDVSKTVAIWTIAWKYLHDAAATAETQGICFLIRIGAETEVKANAQATIESYSLKTECKCNWCARSSCWNSNSHDFCVRPTAFRSLSFEKWLNWNCNSNGCCRLWQ